MMARTRSQGSSARGRRMGGRNKAHPLGAVEFFTRPEQHLVWQVLGFLVRARAELFVATVTVVVFLHLQGWATTWMTPEDVIGEASPVFGPPHVALLIMLGAVAIVLVIPASRRAINRRMWCVTTRHRMRSCFMQSRTMNHNGRLPFLLWSRPSPVGERVRVWLPAGLSVKDIEDDTQRLATACWAREARITPTRAQAALVIVDIVRRDPLGTRTVLEPTVLDNLDDTADEHTTERNGTVVPLPDRAALTPVPTADTPPTATSNGGNGSGPRSTRKTPATTNGSARTEKDPEPAVTGFGGVDVSDYV